MAEERAGKKPRNDDDAIPDEIFPSKVIEVILMKLPVKSLARFKAVAKSWAETISSPQFNIRRLKPRPQTECIIWGWEPHTDAFSLMRLDISGNDHFTIDPSEYTLESPALPLYSSNGVLLLKSFSGDEMSLSLVNPTLRSESEVIKILTQRRAEDLGVSHGHYYDPRVDDYKVAVIHRANVGRRNECFSVYSCRRRIWSMKTPLRVAGVELESGVFVNGCFYWWAPEERMVAGLNVGEGTVGMSGGPAELRSVDSNDKIRLFELTGRLGLYSRDKEFARLRVWVMEKDGLEACFGTWRELNIPDENEQVFLSGEEDRVVLITNGSLKKSRFMIYQDTEKCYTGVECDFPADATWHNLIQHSETLFSLRRFLQKKKEAAGSSSTL